MEKNEKEQFTAALSANGLHVERGGHPVLTGLTFDVQAGEVFALLGGNGAGKSTTLLTFLGLLEAAEGEALVFGRSAADDAAAVRSGIAYLPENAALYEHLSALENLAYFLSLAGSKRSKADLVGALQTVGLPDEAVDRRLGLYSKGMRQKVAIALALLRESPVLLLDEPTSGLDPIAIEEFNTLLDTLRGRGVAILMVTHDLLGACEVAGRIGMLREGRIVALCAANEGEPIDVEHVRKLFVAGEPV